MISNLDNKCSMAPNKIIVDFLQSILVNNKNLKWYNQLLFKIPKKCQLMIKNM
jgi:hypothetical protein